MPLAQTVNLVQSPPRSENVPGAQLMHVVSVSLWHAVPLCPGPHVVASVQSLHRFSLTPLVNDVFPVHGAHLRSDRRVGLARTYCPGAQFVSVSYTASEAPVPAVNMYLKIEAAECLHQIKIGSQVWFSAWVQSLLSFVHDIQRSR